MTKSEHRKNRRAGNEKSRLFLYKLYKVYAAYIQSNNFNEKFIIELLNNTPFEHWNQFRRNKILATQVDILYFSIQGYSYMSSFSLDKQSFRKMIKYVDYIHRYQNNRRRK